MKPKSFRLITALILISACLAALPVSAFAHRNITDAWKRPHVLPDQVEQIICSGPGCLRLISYLQARDKVVAVDDIEPRKKSFDARPYALAYPEYKDLPVFGGFRGHDDPEKILGLDSRPQVIFKTYGTMGYDPVELEQKTGIPVFVLEYGDLGTNRNKLFQAITLMGEVLGLEQRALDLISFFNREIENLEKRTAGIQDRKTCFVGGIAFKGPHGFQSTEPSYPPFGFINAKNIAAASKKGAKIQQSNFSKEKLLITDPDILFLDLSTLQMGKGRGGLYELETDPIFQALTAVKSAKVFGVLPYNWYTRNFGSVLANAWFMGKILYPENFKDIHPGTKADEIYKFLLNKKVFSQMDDRFSRMVFKPVDLKNQVN